MRNTSACILAFQEIDKTKWALVGGKGANLGELCRIEGIHVPDGFCLSTEAFQRIMRDTASIHELLDQLARLKVEDRAGITAVSANIRRVIEEASIPRDMQDEIVSHIAEKNAYAVRSSATAEDLPTASFAGQQDTYLNIIGREAILQHIRKCWASLYTDRAVIYRLQNGYDHRKVHVSVVIQKMVFPDVAGIMFTADPISFNRKMLSIDASFGLGEALVSGLVNPDNYKVGQGKIIDKAIGNKKLAVLALGEGGTQEKQIDPGQQGAQALSDQQILELAHIGRKIEAHFGCPQDIEWCLVDGVFHIVQSRPITTLFPIPEANDQENHVYLSVGHNQMMTDAMKPLGLSFFLLTTRAPMRTAGGRLFVDCTQQLASPEGRKKLIDTFGPYDPLTKHALMSIVEREDFMTSLPGYKKEADPGNNSKGIPPAGPQAQMENDAAVVSGLIQRSQASLEELKQKIKAKSGTELFDFILEDIQELKKFLISPDNMRVIMAAMEASLWINEKMKEWLGEKKPADTLSQSVPNNVTSEMGLALLDVADVIRPYPAVVAYFQQAKDAALREELVKLDGGRESWDAIQAYLEKYGMRCAGEIDITKTRWSEKPGILVPLLLSNIKNSAPNSGPRKFEQGRHEALKKEQELLSRLKELPDGERKAEETRQKIALVRNFIGYREYPKYSMVSRYFVYKQAMLKEAVQLVQAGVIQEKEDIYYLSFEELRELVSTHELDNTMLSHRKDAYKHHEKLSPPRVITSDGEVFSGGYKRDNLPAGAMAGLAVSSGLVEGRARVILNMEDAELEEGDILVTVFTDPSWTPLFVSIKGLVTEVGGLMTHGAVIAREYGLPAVVGVENATKVIQDGQRIRVHGTEGYVEIL